MIEKQKGFPLLPQVTTVGENIISANNNFTGNNTFAGDTTFTGNVQDGSGNDFVTEIDYATKSSTGVVQIGDGISVDADGVISSTEVTENGEVVNTFDADKKANTDGFYEGMSVGHALEADQLASDREIEDADKACPPIVFGPIGGTAEVQDGYSKFTELRGNTICWNQLFIPRSTVTTGGVTVTNNGDGSFTLSNTATDEVYLNLSDSQYPVKYIQGHKYLLKGGVNTIAELSASASAITGSWAGNTPIIFTANSSADSGYVRVKIVNGTTYNNVKIIPQLFDLTQMFGVGNEPSTVEEFTPQFPNPYYAYNAGQLLSSKSASMILRGRNQWDEQWILANGNSSTGVFTPGSSVCSENYIRILPNTKYYIRTPKIIYCYFYDANKTFISIGSITVINSTVTTPANAEFLRFQVINEYGQTYNHDIVIYINYDTPNLPYVPYEQQVVTLPNLELKSAGTVYDVAYQEGGGKRRIGSVDLGTLDWVAASYGNINGFYSTGISSICKHPSQAICKLYVFNSNDSTFNNNNVDMEITINLLGNVKVKNNSAGTDASAFKTAMSGVYLYYELATETDITTVENPGWTELVKIDNFGTIEFTVDPAQTPQVPQAYFIRYTVNLGEWVDTAYVRTGGDPNNIMLKSENVIPDIPSTDGTYVLKATKSGTTITYTWVQEV